MKTLSHEEARRIYDFIGSKQDSQAFYEDVATRDLVRHGEFATARAVFEFGCGTGRFAKTLLAEHLGAKARYVAVDVSPKMVALARQKLSEFGDRARVVLSDGNPRTSEPAASFDRFVSNYVLDLLSEEDIRSVVAEAHRLLRPGGLLCLASLAPGKDVLSRAVMAVWSFLHGLNPKLVGGCRPIDLLPFLSDNRWKLRHRQGFAPYGLPSEAVIAERV